MSTMSPANSWANSWAKYRHVTCQLGLLLGLSLMLPCCYGFSVCVFTDGPAGYASCMQGGRSASATGYDVEMFRNTAAVMGWKEVEGSADGISLSTAAGPNATYSFVCQSRTAAKDVYLTTMANGSMPLASCAVAIGRVEQNAKLAFLGARFSQPWLKAPFVVLVDAGNVEQKVDPWSWTKPFAGGIWASMACNLILVAVCLWLIERFQRPGVQIKVEKEELDHLKLNTYRTILAMFSQDIMPVHTPTAQIVVVAYLFTILILLATYTANLTASLTLGSTTTTITDVTQLQSMKVLAASNAALSANMWYSVNSTKIDLNSDAAWMTVQQSLANKTYDAFIGRMPEVDYYRNRLDSACHLSIAADSRGYKAMDLGAMFHAAVPRSIVVKYGAAIWTLRDSSQIYTLRGSHLMQGNTTCPVKDLSITVAAPVKLEQLLGLWVILGFGFFAALLQAGWMVAQYVRTTMAEARQTGDKSMTFTKAMSTMVLNDAPEEDTDLPPEMRTHKIQSALAEIMLRRANSAGSMRGSMNGAVQALGASDGQASMRAHTSGAVPSISVDTPATPEQTKAGPSSPTNMTAPSRKSQAGVTFGSASLDLAGPTSDLIPVGQSDNTVHAFEERAIAEATAPRTTEPAPPMLERDLQEEEVLEL